MNFKQDTNSWPKLSKEKWHSLDKHAETIGVILGANIVKPCILGMMSGKRRRGRPRMQYIDNINTWTRASLEENIREWQMI